MWLITEDLVDSHPRDRYTCRLKFVECSSVTMNQQTNKNEIMKRKKKMSLVFLYLSLVCKYGL